MGSGAVGPDLAANEEHPRVAGERKSCWNLADTRLISIELLHTESNEPTTTAGTDIMGIEKIEEAMDFVNNRRSGNGLATPSISCAPHSTWNNSSDENYAQIPLELVAHRVASLLICTERDFPPADVARIPDSAATILQPYCLPDLPVYAKMQKYMEIIKNQILDSCLHLHSTRLLL
ncbi:hypothetical protein KPL70_001943 [Citrus sinensis]|nr:hypothetical protein KPL70_001943 [Citrus sinensis]